MDSKEKAANAKVAALKAIRGEFTGTSAAAQKERLRRAFECFPMLNTQEMREHLAILHPAGRVKELRDDGENIATLWVTYQADGGSKHRIANYLRVREAVDA